MANPVMTRNPVFGDKAQFTQGSYGYGQGSADQQYYSPNTIDLEHAYAQPAATPLHTDRMTYDDVLVRTGIIFAVLLVGAALGWVGVFTFGMGLAIGYHANFSAQSESGPSPLRSCQPHQWRRRE